MTRSIHTGTIEEKGRDKGGADSMTASIGKERIFNKEFAKRGKEGVVMWDIFTVKDGEKVKVTFESKSSSIRQGVWLKTDQGILVNGEKCGSVSLWEDTAPKEVVCTCFTKDGNLSIYNTWEDKGQRGSQGWSSGMIVEELPSGRRYRCNDIGFETNFDKIIFRVERAG
jgi:hypothetical protein